MAHEPASRPISLRAGVQVARAADRGAYTAGRRSSTTKPEVCSSHCSRAAPGDLRDIAKLAERGATGSPSRSGIQSLTYFVGLSRRR